MNECYYCSFYDQEYEGCTCPSTDKWYACPIEKELKKMAEWYHKRREEVVNERN